MPVNILTWMQCHYCTHFLSYAKWYQNTGSSFIQVKVCHLFGTKPLSEKCWLSVKIWHYGIKISEIWIKIWFFFQQNVMHFLGFNPYTKLVIAVTLYSRESGDILWYMVECGHGCHFTISNFANILKIYIHTLLIRMSSKSVLYCTITLVVLYTASCHNE